MPKRVRIALGAVWLLTLVVVAQVALATRDPGYVGTQDSAGPTIVAFTLPAIGFAIWNLRQRVVGVLTIVVATVVSSCCAWTVLFDTHSTAAIGIPAPGIYAIVIVAAGIVLEGGVRRATSKRPASGAR